MLLPDMKHDFHLSNTQTGMLATANLSGYLLLSVIAGALAVRFGARAVITIGLSVAALGMLLTGLSGSFATVIAWRALTGIGSASNVPAVSLLSAWFARHRRGLAAGIAVTGSSLALIVLGPLVPYVTSLNEKNGWRECWFIFAGTTFLLAILALVCLRNKPAALGLNPLGASEDEVSSIPVANGIHWGSVYRSRVVWHVGIIYVAFGFSYIIYMTYFTQYLIVKGAYTKIAAGQLFMFMGWMSLLCGLIWGWVSDIIGRKRALIIVYLLHATAFGLFGLCHEPVGFIISAALFGLSAWSIPAIMAAACGDLLGPRLAPAALGFITLFFGVGQAAGPYIAGSVADAAGGSLSPAMLLAAAVALMGAGAAFLLRHPALGLISVKHQNR